MKKEDSLDSIWPVITFFNSLLGYWNLHSERFYLFLWWCQINLFTKNIFFSQVVIKYENLNLDKETKPSCTSKCSPKKVTHLHRLYESWDTFWSLRGFHLRQKIKKLFLQERINIQENTTFKIFFCFFQWSIKSFKFSTNLILEYFP